MSLSDQFQPEALNKVLLIRIGRHVNYCIFFILVLYNQCHQGNNQPQTLHWFIPNWKLVITMESQEIAVSEYIGALLVILIITLTQVAFSCYCCYAVFWRKAAKCPCETSSKCPCAKNSDPEKNLPGTDDEITGLDEDIDDLVKEGPKTEERTSIQ